MVAVVSSGKEADGAGIGCTGQAEEEVDRVDALLGGGADRAHDPALSGGSSLGVVASPDLAVHHHRADGLLAPPVGGADVGGVEEGEEGVGLRHEVRDQPAVRVMGWARCPSSSIRSARSSATALRLRADSSRALRAARRILHLAGRAPRPVRQVGLQFDAPAEKMGVRAHREFDEAIV